MNRLSVRLTLAFLMLTWLAIGAVAVVLLDTIEGGFRDYVQGQESSTLPEFLPAALETYYAENGSWAGAESQFPGRGQGRQYFVVDSSQVVVASSDPDRLGDTFSDADLQDGIALNMDSEAVGWLFWQTPGQQRFGEAEQAFLNDMSGALLVIAGVVGLLALGVGIGLGWQLTRPLERLTAAVRGLSAGQRGQQVALRGSKEVKQLAFAFNEMSAALERSEIARQRIAADVAHELRTPVTVLRGHLEGMLDDVLPNSKEQIAIAYDQTLHLKRLVEDLRLLTLAEVRQLPLDKQAIKLAEFLNGVYQAFEPLALDQNIHLENDSAENLPDLYADEGRLRQVFGNLLTNALRHTPPEGRITLVAETQGDQVILRVSNSGSGLSAEDAARLFDPFWRADQARNRDRGGSGLGLAIARQLIELHGGSIRVETSVSATTFIIVLPSAGR